MASEMERQGFEIPLLIGGATTSRAHTAVKVDEKYHGPVVWVKDASRSVPVVAQLLSDEQRPKLMDTVKADYDSLRARHAAKSTDRPLTSIAAARANATPVDWAAYRPPVPHVIAAAGEGAASAAVRREAPRDHPVRAHVARLPAGRAARLHRLGAVLPGLGDEAAGSPTSSTTPPRARRRRGSTRTRSGCSTGSPTRSWLRADGVVGLFPANAVGDDIEVYTDETRTRR